MMRYLMQEFVDNTSKEADRVAQLRDETDFQQAEVKVPAIHLFIQLGNLFDQQLKRRMTDQKDKKKKNDTLGPSGIEQHLLIDDQNITAMSRAMKVKVGAFLTNLMCKNLKFKVGHHDYLLLKPQVVKKDASKPGKGYLGFISFNKGFIEDFIGELDKIHDLNLQMDRSVPMIYPPAPWKNFYFGGYYLKQTKMAKVLP
jgi:DNA-directed RNA polymerase